MLSLGLSLLLSCHPISQLANHLYPVVWETPGQTAIRVAWLYLCHPHQAEPRKPEPSLQGLCAGHLYCPFPLGGPPPYPHPITLPRLYFHHAHRCLPSGIPPLSPECSQGRVPCIYSCAYHGTTVPETRTQFTSPAGQSGCHCRW